MVTFAMIDLHTHKRTHGIQLLEFRDKGINPYTALITTVEAFLREAEKAVVLCDRSGEGRRAAPGGRALRWRWRQETGGQLPPDS